MAAKVSQSEDGEANEGQVNLKYASPRIAKQSTAQKAQNNGPRDHPMAFFARLGIFLPPFMVAAFTIFIRPYPEKPHYRAMVEDMEDYRNPSRVRPATQCVVLFGALISCTSLAFALQLHAPPVLATPQKRPVLRVTEWTVDRWPLFFHPKGLTASEDALIVTTDFAVARFQHAT
eukprot:s1574_g16.t1